MRLSLKSGLFLVGLTLFTGAASAQPKELKPRTPQVAPSLDKVQVESFVSEPAQVQPGTALVVLRVTVKNVTNSNLATGYVLNGLKVRILRTNPQPDVLELETTISNLAAGASQTVGARVNIAAGVREYFARVDPDDTLHEPLVQRANNEKRLKLTIPQVAGQAPPAGAAPQKETMLLDYDKAKRSGARFGASLERSSPPSVCLAHQGEDPGVGVRLGIGCSSTGGRSNPEAYMNFRLKHGWKIKSFDVVKITKAATADWGWIKTPSIGSDDPSSKVHLWADPLGQLGLSVKIEIEGPAGTNPYQ